MSKVEISTAAEVMKRHEIAPDKLRSIVEELNNLTQADADGESPPAQKRQFVVLLSDPAGTLPKQDLVGWVLQIPEDASPYSVTERLFKGAYDFNASKRGRMLQVKSVGEALESAGAKFFKEADLFVKTKMPVAVIVTNNVLPRADFKIEKVSRHQ